MAGTVEGGRKAAKTNRRKYGKNFYAVIGAKGGKNGHTGGFAAGEKGRELARRVGAMGGRISKRRHRFIGYDKDGKAQYLETV